jgi:iron(III) transport system ATP-binding protein
VAFIDIDGIGKTFGHFQALTDICLSIKEREFVTFLGPSGCGKTTMLRTLAGFITPDAGTIAVDGRLLSEPGAALPPEQRQMGMVFQNYAIWPHMSVFENVAFGLRIARLPDAEVSVRVGRVLEAVGLEGLARRHPGQLSGGQQQRVALARSLVVEPKILLLDEPLSNLDAKLRERMRVELKALQRRTGITFIYVTHDQAEAMALSDRIVVFNKGRMQQQGSPRDIYERPANLFVADFMGLVNRISGAWAGPSQVRIGAHVLDVTSVASSRTGAVTVASRTGAVTVASRTGAVTVAIRPEALVPVTGPVEGRNLIEGTVLDSVFLGNIVDLSVDIGGAELHVQADRWCTLATGDPVRLAVDPAECVAMENE